MQIIQAGFGTNSSLYGLCSNVVLDSKQNTRAYLPNELWTRVFPNSSSVTFTGSIRSGTFQTYNARVTGNFTLFVAPALSSSTFVFTGTGVQFLSCTGPQFGMARIYLDGDVIEDVDASLTPSGIYPNPVIGYCNQMLYQNTSLGYGGHNFTIEVLQQFYTNSSERPSNIAVSGFAYISGVDQCQSNSASFPDTPLAETYLSLAISNWMNYKSKGKIGPNNTDSVEFQGSELRLPSSIQLPSQEGLTLPPANVPVLAPFPIQDLPLSFSSVGMGPPAPNILAPTPAVGSAAG